MRKHSKIFVEVAVILLVILFLHTALSKILDFKGFVYDLNNQPFPNSLTPFLSYLLPGSEIAIAFCLCIERSRLTGLYVSLVLMSLFTIYTALVLFGAFAYVPCSCGGVVKYLTWPQHLALNIFFVTITATAIALKNRSRNYQTKDRYLTQTHISGQE
ncbi:MauE/DoxX family redox-associated membrane protein [Pedobacter sp. ASV28]|uniref:MauE/DoxX family redox-associated membrane protein n=1 Tax=Pedobacter sp. ASV28 TaxID=2795123 RepID=UPI0018EA41A3|nr:MauE/DoxX family redox-associated membrane protein [Pedobacter sp. ASV28]